MHPQAVPNNLTGVKSPKKAVKKTARKAGLSTTETANQAEISNPGDTGHRWTFLTNHSHVLVLLHRDPDLVLRQVAQLVGITERAVQRIIQDLEDGGFLRRERVGRRNHYQVLTSEHLRHPIEKHCSIGQLLQLLAGD